MYRSYAPSTFDVSFDQWSERGLNNAILHEVFLRYNIFYPVHSVYPSQIKLLLHFSLSPSPRPSAFMFVIIDWIIVLHHIMECEHKMFL